MGEELYTISSGKILSLIELKSLLDTFDMNELNEFRYDPANAHLKEPLREYFLNRVRAHVGLE